MNSLIKLCNNYKQFALTRPDLVTDIETGIRWMSYFVPSKTRESAVLSEMLFCASKLMALFHDSIFERYINGNLSKIALPEAKIFKFLKVLSCVEVFTEMASVKFGGTVARWIIIASIQLIKVVCRLLLIYKYNFSIIRTNSSETLDRKAVTEYLNNCPPTKSQTTNSKGNEKGKNDESVIKNGISMRSAFTLKSTGRIVQMCSGGETKPQPNLQITSPCPQKLIGEMIFTLRPLVHLLSLALFGQQAWMPWLTACGMDMCSIYVAGKSSSLQPIEVRELNQRTLSLFLYLMRSPFYSRFSKRKLLSIVNGLKRFLPIGNALWASIESYTELWDQIYFYSWDS